MTDSALVSIDIDTSSKQLPLINTAVFDLTLTRLKDSMDVQLKKISSITNRPEGITQDTTTAVVLTMRSTLDGRLAKLRSTDAQKCRAAIEPTASRIFDLLVPLPPANSSTGTIWVDTVEAVVCHGKVSLRQQTIRRFVYLADTIWQSQPAIRIQKSGETIISSLEPDSLNRIITHGNGSETATMIVNYATGQLFSNVETSELSLQIETSRGQFPFHEHLNSHIQHQ